MLTIKKLNNKLIYCLLSCQAIAKASKNYYSFLFVIASLSKKF